MDGLQSLALNMSLNELRPRRCYWDFLAGPISSESPVTRHCQLSPLWPNQGPSGHACISLPFGSHWSQTAPTCLSVLVD